MGFFFYNQLEFKFSQSRFHLRKAVDMDERVNITNKVVVGIEGFFHQYIENLSAILNNAPTTQIDKVVHLFLQARERNRMIFFAGNGGSAATASHFSRDLAQVGNSAGVAGFRTYCLTDSVPHITSSGNDLGYDQIFTSQMEPLFDEGDILVVISASGNSQNVINATSLAQKKKGKVVALVGFDGGVLANLADILVHFETPKDEYGLAEDSHHLLGHAITLYLIDKFKNNGR